MLFGNKLSKTKSYINSFTTEYFIATKHTEVYNIVKVQKSLYIHMFTFSCWCSLVDNEWHSRHA